MSPAGTGVALANVSLDDKYALDRGRVFLTGTQAIVRLLILQQHLHTVYGVDLAHTRVALDYPPTAHAARYPRYFRGAIQFDAHRNALVVPGAWRATSSMAVKEAPLSTMGILAAFAAWAIATSPR